MTDNRNLILAIVLSAIMMLGWEYFVVQPQMQAERARQALLLHRAQAPAATHPEAPKTEVQAQSGPGNLPRNQALAQSGARIAIDTPTLDGSLRLKGARFDDLRLKHYRETINPKSPEVVLFSPERTAYPYYASLNWDAAPTSKLRVPDGNSLWTISKGTRLTPATPVTLTWNNGQGLVFTRTITIDRNYLFQIRDTVANRSQSSAALTFHADVVRDGVPTATHFWALHEGFVGIADGTLRDADYTDFKNTEPPQKFPSTGGWFGITDKYWMATVIPPQNAEVMGLYQALPLDSSNSKKAYIAGYSSETVNVASGYSYSVNSALFAGAKIVKLLRTYEDKNGISKFDMAIDWGHGWLFIGAMIALITQPIFDVLDFLSRYMNVGLAILLLTVGMKLLFFPLANASYRSMSRMKKLQPEVERLRERFAEDKMRQQQEMMELYKREKVNPLSGCLPMMLQIPVFFALYKVLLGAIEMRQAPFFGWIHDLSAPDPTSFVNLFGLLPYGIPSFIPAFLHVGLWPILMGASQWVQTKMNPAPADPVQARMFAFMPLLFVFMLANLPAGLVIYWTWSNILSVAQQYVMMRRQGVEVHLFNNLKAPQFLKRLPFIGARAKTEAGE